MKKNLDPGALLPALLAAAAAAGLWAVFRPGLLSFDSIAQYGQALRGSYTDWHPALISIALHFVLALGGSLSRFMALQCLAGALGVFAFARAAMRRLHGERLPPRRAAWLALATLLVLLIPVSPLGFYLMTFWKDVWAMILLLWIGALALGGDPEAPPSRARLAGLVLLGAAFGMVRHNAVVTLPLLGFFLWAETRRRSRRAALLLAVAPLAACLALGPLIDAAFEVKETYPESQVMAFDLAGLCAEDHAACARFSFFRRYLRVPEYRNRYRPGDIGSIFWEEPVIVDRHILDGPVHEQLAAEYREAVKDHPLLLAELKGESFWRLLGTEGTFYFFHDSAVPNKFGLVLQEPFRPFREELVKFGHDVEKGPWRWVAGVHLVWLAADLAWIAVLLRLWRRTEEGRFRSLALFLLVPLGYYLSYLLAAPVADFRFMYPSTLVVQGFTAAAALGSAGISRRQKPSGRAPYRASVSE